MLICRLCEENRWLCRNGYWKIMDWMLDGNDVLE